MAGVTAELRLFARQWAWLSSKRSKSAVTRWEEYVKRGEEVRRPKLSNYAEIIFDICVSVGLYQPGSYGPQALTWSELDCWVRLNGVKLSGWEARTVVDVSKAFVEQYETSNEHDVPSPWIPEDIDRDKIAADIGQIMRRLKTRRNRHG